MAKSSSPPALGKIGKFVAAFSPLDSQFALQPQGFAGEKKRQKNPPESGVPDYPPAEDVWGRRHARERMNAALRKLIWNGALPRHPVSGCRVRAIPRENKGKPTGFSGLIELRHFEDDPCRHSYHGDRCCRSLGVCAECQAEFGPRIRALVRDAVRRLLQAGYYCFMITLTAQHTRKMPLATLSEGFQEAKRWLLQHRLWRRMKEELGVLGELSALEVTDDAPDAPVDALTGWHWHQHILVFYRPPNDFRGWFTEKYAAHFERRFRRLWQRALRTQGLDCSLEHGARLTLPRRHGIDALQVASGQAALESEFRESMGYFGAHGVDTASAMAAAEYVAKGLTWELTGSIGVTKTGRQAQRISMYEMLWRITSGDTRLIPRYDEYMAAIRGRSIVRWSQGIKAFAGLPDDEEAAMLESREAGDVVDYAWTEKAFRPVARHMQRTNIRRIADAAGENAPDAVDHAMDVIGRGCDPVTGEVLPVGIVLRGRRTGKPIEIDEAPSISFRGELRVYDPLFADYLQDELAADEAEFRKAMF